MPQPASCVLTDAERLERRVACEMLGKHDWINYRFFEKLDSIEIERLRMACRRCGLIIYTSGFIIYTNIYDESAIQ